MDKQNYLVLSEGTEHKFPDGLVLSCEQAEFLHAVLGLITESGELGDQLKKNLIYGKPLDWVNVVEELGDIYWYIAIILRKLENKSISEGDVMRKNIEKLAARYPEKFTSYHALNRDLDKERKILEG